MFVGAIVAALGKLLNVERIRPGDLACGLRLARRS
jgi:hypothetical protein